MTQKRLVSIIPALLLIGSISLSAVDGKKAEYTGGTIAGLKDKAEGTLDTSKSDALVFDAKKDGTASIPYAAITGLEYGQKAGRRVAVAVLVSPLALFSKKRNHYLTIGYNDEAGKEQVGVFELGKDIVRTSLKIIETRSGKNIEYQDEEARKSGMGGK